MYAKKQNGEGRFIGSQLSYYDLCWSYCCSVLEFIRSDCFWDPFAKRTKKTNY